MGEAIRETVDRCEQLISSLLLLARSEAADGRGEALDVGAIAGDCITDLRARAQEAGLEVSAHLEAAWVEGHPGLIERMVANLIDNAIRHNRPGGHVMVQTRFEGDVVALVVANGGAQIDPADVAGLTTPFRRLDRTVSGFGLGLSIVRSVAEAHHGQRGPGGAAERGPDGHCHPARPAWRPFSQSSGSTYGKLTVPNLPLGPCRAGAITPTANASDPGPPHPAATRVMGCRPTAANVRLAARGPRGSHLEGSAAARAATPVRAGPPTLEVSCAAAEARPPTRCRCAADGGRDAGPPEVTRGRRTTGRPTGACRPGRSRRRARSARPC